MSVDPELQRRQRRLAANRRWHPEQPELVADDQRALKAAAAERYIDKLNDPPLLTLEVRARLAGMLLTPGDAP